ncbi:MAG: hypothetical protein Kow0032_24730 [Methyloligellaceae bacterium]
MSDRQAVKRRSEFVGGKGPDASAASRADESRPERPAASGHREGERGDKGHSWRPNFRVIGISTLVGLVLSLFLILYLSEVPPQTTPAQPRSESGGVTTIAKSAAPRPAARSAMGAAKDIPQRPAAQTPPPGAKSSETTTPVAAAQEPPKQPGLPEPAIPAAGVGREGPQMREPDVPPPPSPAPVKPVNPAPEPQASLPEPPPLPVPAPAPPVRKAPEAAAKAKLPWQTGESAAPVPPSASQRVASVPSSPPAGERGRLPSRSQLRSWLRSEAREFVGGVDEDGLPLYRFDLWIEAPAEARQQVRKITYEYLAPSAQPPQQSSSDPKNGFRVKFGAAACAEKTVVTLVMKDGRERRVSVDGCRILN